MFSLAISFWEKTPKEGLEGSLIPNKTTTGMSPEGKEKKERKTTAFTDVTYKGAITITIKGIMMFRSLGREEITI